jgi:hypothetical protein
MDKLFLQLTNQVDMGYHSERLSLENACIKISKAEQENEELKASLENIDAEIPNLINAHKHLLLDEALNRTFFYHLYFCLFYFIKIHVDASSYAESSYAELSLLIFSPLGCLIAFNLLAISYILTVCGLWESQRSLNKMERSEQILYFTKSINNEIENNKVKNEENIEKAKQHVANMEELERLHNKR